MSLARLVITAVTAEAHSRSAVAGDYWRVYASVSPAAATARLMRTSGGKFSRLRRHSRGFLLDSLLEDV
jgi:hypothetical protein